MKSFEEKLVTTSAQWVESGLITAAQRHALLARHPAGERGRDRFVFILATVGGALVACGLGLLIAANWQGIGAWTKIAGLVGLLGGAHAAGWWLRFSPGRYPKTGDAAFVLGGVLFLLGIALVSQIFHLNSSPADGLLGWWLGIAILPWLLRTPGLQFLSVSAGVSWLAVEMQSAGSWWRLSQSNRWDDGELSLLAFMLVGAALFVGGLVLRRSRWPEFAGLHEKVGLLLQCAMLYGVSWQWSWHRISGDAVADDLRIAPLLVFFALPLVADIVLYRRDRATFAGVGPWLSVLAVPFMGMLVARGVHGGDWIVGAAATVALFIFNLGMIRLGLQRQQPAWINLGLAFIALSILTRYIDLFGTMLEGGVFFIVTGAIVLALGIFLERKRRTLVAATRKGAP